MRWRPFPMYDGRCSHTRQPIVLPSRVDEGLLGWLKTIGIPTVFVLHVKHPNEIDSDVRAACEKLRAAGVSLLNQWYFCAA